MRIQHRLSFHSVDGVSPYGFYMIPTEIVLRQAEVIKQDISKNSDSQVNGRKFKLNAC